MRRLLQVAWDEKELIDELERIRRLREPVEPELAGRSDGFPSATDLQARLVRPIQNRREQLLVELDAPARDWPLPRLGPLQAPTFNSNSPPMLVEGAFSALLAGAFPTNSAGFFGKGTAPLQFMAARQTRRLFSRPGAVAVLGTGVTKENRVRVAAEDAQGEQRWELLLKLDPHRAPLLPSTVEFGRWTVETALTQTSPTMYQREGIRTRSSLELTQVSTNLGGAISGKFRINTTAFEKEKR